jgi:hypothetical protein
VGALPALAEDARVAVQVETVVASLKGNTIDPPTLKAMQEAMSSKVKYGSLKRLAVDKPVLESGKVHTMKLSNGTEATLSLEKIEKDVATVRVKTPSVETTYSTGKKGSLYAPAGKQGEDDLWLVLSPAK